MPKKFFDYIVHGGDYNPDQWIRTPGIWDEDMPGKAEFNGKAMK